MALPQQGAAHLALCPAGNRPRRMSLRLGLFVKVAVTLGHRIPGATLFFKRH
jgi:hypothetical protein